MEIFHDLTGTFVEDGGDEFLLVLAAREGTGIGCMSANIKTSQHFLSGDLADGCFGSGIVGWGCFLIGFYVRRGRGVYFSDFLALYFQGGYAWRATQWCHFRDERCCGLAVGTFGDRCGGGTLGLSVPVSTPLYGVLEGVGGDISSGVATLGGGDVS